jgi:hypothetical protein
VVETGRRAHPGPGGVEAGEEMGQHVVGVADLGVVGGGVGGAVVTVIGGGRHSSRAARVRLRIW